MDFLKKSLQVQYRVLKYLTIAMSNGSVALGIYSSYFFGFDQWGLGLLLIALLFTVGIVDSLITWKCMEFLTGDERKASRKKIKRRKPEYARRYDYLKYLSVFIVNAMIPANSYIGIQFGLGHAGIGHALVGVIVVIGVVESFIFWYLLEWLTEREMRRGKRITKK